MNKMREKRHNKKAQAMHISLLAILSFITLTSGVIFTNSTLNSTITGLVTDAANSEAVAEKTAEFYVYADTIISAEILNNTIAVLLTLDNKTILPEQTIEFYLDNLSVSSGVTNSDGHAFLNFSQYGNYSIFFKGNDALYLNPSSLSLLLFNETIIPENETLPINQTNITLKNETIRTNLALSFEGCKSFEERVLWSSGFTNEPHNSLNYQAWNPKYNCSEIGLENCFIADIQVNSRYISTGLPDNETKGIGYVQISELENCNEPEKGNYEGYVNYDELHGEEIRKNNYCKEEDKKCKNQDFDNAFAYNSCYGIKSYGSQYLIVDVFSVKYELCSKMTKETKNG